MPKIDFEKTLSSIEHELLKLRVRMLENKERKNSFLSKKKLNHNWYQVACGLTFLEKMSQDKFDNFIAKCVGSYEIEHKHDHLPHLKGKNTLDLLKILKSSDQDMNLKILSIEAYLQGFSSSRLYQIVIEQLGQALSDSKPVEMVKSYDSRVIEDEESLIEKESKAYEKYCALHAKLENILIQMKYVSEDDFSNYGSNIYVLSFLISQSQRFRSQECEVIKALKCSIKITPKDAKPDLMIENECEILGFTERVISQSIVDLKKILILNVENIHCEKGTLLDKVQLNRTIREFMFALDEYENIIKKLFSIREQVISEIPQAMRQGKLKEYVKLHKKEPHSFFSKMPTYTEAWDYFDGFDSEKTQSPSTQLK